MLLNKKIYLLLRKIILRITIYKYNEINIFERFKYKIPYFNMFESF